jgi:hypothetical protein
MPRSACTALLLLALAAAAAAQQAEPSMNPCHSNKYLEAAPSCERVQVPEGMCKTCPLRPPRDDGNFQNCAQIFDLDAPGCKEKFQQYVDMNPCDTRRKELVAKWDEESKTRLDYFAYAVCEQCCDVVEQGSKLEEYTKRNEEARLWSLKRGNGPAHFYYDLCTLFPNFKFWALPSGGDHYDYPHICNDLTGWFESPASTNWIANADVQISAPVQGVLGDAVWALQCHDYAIWSRCVDLESKQKRV